LIDANWPQCDPDAQRFLDFEGKYISLTKERMSLGALLAFEQAKTKRLPDALPGNYLGHCTQMNVWPR
jgi:hypothetical protein